MHEEVIELWDQLEEIAEGEEAAIQSPRRALRRITIAAEENNTLTDGFLSREEFGVNVLDAGVRDTIQETKAEGNESRTQHSLIEHVTYCS